MPRHTTMESRVLQYEKWNLFAPISGHTQCISETRGIWPSHQRELAPYSSRRFCIAGLFFVIANLSGFSPFGGDSYTQVGPTVVDSVRNVAKLTTVEMVEYTTVEKGNDFGWLNWARGDRIFLFAVARIGAGVDMEMMTTDNFAVDEDSGRVTVTLPAPEIIFVEVDNGATQVYDRDTGLFTKGDAQLESDARQSSARGARQRRTRARHHGQGRGERQDHDQPTSCVVSDTPRCSSRPRRSSAVVSLSLRRARLPDRAR